MWTIEELCYSCGCLSPVLRVALTEPNIVLKVTPRKSVLWAMIPRWGQYFERYWKVKEVGPSQRTQALGTSLCGCLLPLFPPLPPFPFLFPFSSPPFFSFLLPFSSFLPLLVLPFSFLTFPLPHLLSPLFSPFLFTFSFYFPAFMKWRTTSSTLAQKLTEVP